MHEKIALIILNLLWAGSILGISLESRVKFKAKTLTRPIALDVGRTIFNAFQKAQVVLMAMLLSMIIFLHLPDLEWLTIFLIGIFLFPALNNNANLIFYGKEPEKSFAHSFMVS